MLTRFSSPQGPLALRHIGDGVYAVQHDSGQIGTVGMIGRRWMFASQQAASGALYTSAMWAARGLASTLARLSTLKLEA